jgi:aryl-alcohol dehydrogenase-like predicted oxidoreductase
VKYNELGKTGVLVSELCLGTMTFGGKGYWQAPEYPGWMVTRQAMGRWPD